MDTKTPQVEARLAAGEAELRVEDLQLSTTGTPASFPFPLC